VAIDLDRVGTPIVVIVCLLAASLAAQGQWGTILVQVRAEEKPVEKAEVVVGGARQYTDSTGAAQVQVPAGEVELTIIKDGYVTMTVKVMVGADAQQDVRVDLQPKPTLEETVTVVAATRTNKRLEDQPMRVEVLAREEIEEKMLMTPGDIVMMLNEMGGMRVQATSPSLGAASVRIQGMRGRYTRVLSDGLPLFGEVGGLGLLQVPPMDLGQVEVVKGVASALYGAGAMGGIINLVSRRPTPETQREFLLNRSTRGATDAVTFLASPLSRGWSASLLGGGHWQQINDVNDDAWADLPWIQPRRGPSTRVLGWTRRPLVLRDRWIHVRRPRRRHAERIGSARDRYTVRRSARNPSIRRRRVWPVPASAVSMSSPRERQSRGRLTIINSAKCSNEIITTLPSGRWRFVAPPENRHGSAASLLSAMRIVRATFPNSSTPSSFRAHSDNTTTPVGPAVSLSASGRIDFHSEYGTFFSPRVSVLARSGRWTSRASVGHRLLRVDAAHLRRRRQPA
jgi:iron complex outermembrane receptor protein